MSAIYAISNAINGNLYIGSAKNYAKRSARHLLELRKGTHHSEHLQRAYNKYGDSSFEFSIVEYVDDEKKLLEREQVWMDFFKPAYNVAKFAEAPTRGRKLSAETRRRISAANKGHKWYPMSPEAKARMIAGKVGRKHTDEARAKMRASLTPERIASQTAKVRGWKMTPEQRAKWEVGMKAYLDRRYPWRA